MALSSRYRRSGNRKRRLDPEVLVLLVKYADDYKSLTKTTKRGLHKNMCAEIMELNKARAAKEEPPLPMPSVKALERQIGKISLFDLAVGREGRESALRKFGILGEGVDRSEEHTSELQSLMRISYAVFCLKKKNKIQNHK